MKYLSYFFSLAGAFIIGNYIGIYILGNYMFFETGYFEFSRFITLYNKTFGYHFLGLTGAALLLLSSFLQIKTAPIYTQRIRALLVDLFFILVFYLFFDSIENNNETGGVLSFKFLQGEYFKSKICFFLILISLYYFIGKVSGGTLGKRIFKSKSESITSKSPQLIISLLKTIIYVFPILIMYLYLLLSGIPVFRIVDYDIYNAFLYFSFVYYFILILSIVIDFRHYTVAGHVWKTKSDSNKL